MARYYGLRWSILILLGLFIYGQTFHFDFVFDDYLFIVNNPFIRDFGRVPLIWHYYPMTRSLGFYSFALNYSINQLHAQGYHVFNLMVHFMATGLVWALSSLLFRITGTLQSQPRLARELPFVIAVLFLVHPCQTQAVSYISQRFESMAAVFYLGAVYCYLRARISTVVIRQFIFGGLVVVLAFLGILTKEIVITVPGMILVSEWILFPKKAKPRLNLYMALCLAGILLYLLFSKLLSADLTIFLHSIPSESHQGDVLTPVRYFLTQMRVFLTFLRLLVLPVHQNLDYDYPVSTGLLSPPLTLLGLGMVVLFIFIIFQTRRRYPLMAFGLAWVLITFSINLAPRRNLIFEHKLYLISFGFFLSMVVFLAVWVRDHRRLGVFLGCLAACLVFGSFQRNKVWQDSGTLWQDTVLKSPHKARPYGNLGMVYLNRGNIVQALLDFNKAIEINPSYSEAYNNRGSIYYQQGGFSKAMADFDKAIALNQGYDKPYANRGLVEEKQGHFAQALSDFNKAIAINADCEEAYTNRGIIFAQQGLFDQALDDFNRAVDINPHEQEALNNRGLIYERQGRWDEAISSFNRAIEINPDNPAIYNNRGLAYKNEGRLSQAVRDIDRSIEISPGYAEAYYNRGLMGIKQNNFIQAMLDFDKAIKINPDYAKAYFNRAIVLYQLRKFKMSLDDMRKAKKLGLCVNPVLVSALTESLDRGQ